MNYGAAMASEVGRVARPPTSRSAVHQSGNCQLPRTQEAKKNGTWEKLSMITCVNVDTFPKIKHFCLISRFVRVILAQGPIAQMFQSDMLIF